MIQIVVVRGKHVFCPVAISLDHNYSFIIYDNRERCQYFGQSFCKEVKKSSLAGALSFAVMDIVQDRFDIVLRGGGVELHILGRILRLKILCRGFFFFDIHTAGAQRAAAR